MKNILICTDGSNYSHEACLYGAWLSQHTNASISVLYVTDLRQFEIPAVADFSGSLGIQPFEGMVSQLHEVEEVKAQFVKEHALKTLQGAGVDEVKITFHHETGLLVDVMSDYADMADLVLMGKRGENANFATEHLGSMLERVLRSVEQPCLVTNRQFKPIDSIAIAYDGGASCRKALNYIIANEPFRSMDLHIIVCVEGHKEDEATQRLNEAEAVLKAAALAPTCQMLTGEVETAIAEYVVQSDIDLLLLGAYGHSRIRELLIGSTTTELLRSCYVPVLCFR
ncbi:universal stress protein [Coraliomargarita sp. SDUM461004]|uniref:Universal stress protein n=1 Tax=Thalassobacterium sedimentorum TaxID=3041258 RepID=A0ABU1AGD8_9BACT|nr:universal stress protein [Coraliomargarita sp. SDUM461004]MDQ8193887.1 universal stress protein [Coraliomargarita sp. SDUM461004]